MVRSRLGSEIFGGDEVLLEMGGKGGGWYILGLEDELEEKASQKSVEGMVEGQYLSELFFGLLFRPEKKGESFWACEGESGKGQRMWLYIKEGLDALGILSRL